MIENVKLVRSVSEIPITPNSLYILDYDKTLVENNRLKDDYLLSWLAQIPPSSYIVICTYRDHLISGFTEMEMHRLKIGFILNYGLIPYRVIFKNGIGQKNIIYAKDKGKAIQEFRNQISRSWENIYFVDDMPNALEEMSINPDINLFLIY